MKKTMKKESINPYQKQHFMQKDSKKKLGC